MMHLHESLRATVSTSLLLLILIVSGCGYGLTEHLAKSGIATERPIHNAEPTGPVAAAFISPDGRHLTVCFHAEFRGKVSKRWLNVAKEDLARYPAERAAYTRCADGCIVQVPGAYCDKLLASRPRWDTDKMQPLQLAALNSPLELPAGPFLGVQRLPAPNRGSCNSADNRRVNYAFSCHFDMSATPEPDILYVVLPERTRRSAGGVVLQAFLPVMVVIDAAGELDTKPGFLAPVVRACTQGH